MPDQPSSDTSELDAIVEHVDLPADEVESLVRHLRDQLIGYFGAEVFEVWRAKDGLHKHDAEEVAAVAVAKLAPVVELLKAGSVSKLVEDGRIGQPVTFPWENRW